jgi:cyclopropane fatty-acyl-phospholipid synthase-like methyltransferase
MEYLTQQHYWEVSYAKTGDDEVDITSYRQMHRKVMINLLSSVINSGDSVIEIGAGGSEEICQLARLHPDCKFTGVDYTTSGCDLLERKAASRKLSVQVKNGDMFDERNTDAYDVAYSIGLLEHFTSLAKAVTAIMKFVRPGGTVVTLIPNMAFLNGWLTKRFNPQCYQLHVPHTKRTLDRGHREAGLHVCESGYLGSVNFGILSACFQSPAAPYYSCYLWLSRLTHLCWLFESRVCSLPPIALFAPYIFVIARKAY